jgi:hypothetical protein
VTRLVLLGASNIRRGLPIVVETAREAFGPELEILGAFGHGRSYGARSRIPFRCLPGILESGLWQALDGSSPAAESAVVTDVGNDILYGADAGAILGWVRGCVDRLTERRAAIRITGLPLARLRRTGASEYRFFRTMFFPASRVAHETALEAASEIDAGLRRLAEETGATIVEPRGDWYGVDPIHIRPRARRSAWGEILGVPAASARISFGETLRLRAAAPALRWLAGIERHRKQPSFVARDGTRVALY